MTLSSSLYTGWVMHRRLRPRLHRFKYRVAWLLLDLETLTATAARLRLLSHNRFNLFAIHDRDFGHGDGPLRDQIMRRVREAGIEAEIRQVCLLAMPRVLGFGFNPLITYFCFDASAQVRAVVYEVHNTFGERHSYVLEAQADRQGKIRHSAPKNFYVSPFMDMDMSYAFRVVPPGETVAIGITGTCGSEQFIHAVLHGRRHQLTDGRLLLAFAAYPLLTLKVIAAIHWEALRLWLKGLRLRSRTPDPVARTTVVKVSRPVARSSHSHG